ncbi:hypothetical protein ACH5RR_020635 [Cinchona calisaya]|uniref:Protein kinase domain-containing protein n=1 Tax=Cinchona calisaya TaxID=153742 RepID=A0ABD2ZF18_9GENT
MDHKVKVENSWLRTTVIGKGSFGTVSLAVNKSNGALFAVKSVDTTSLTLSSQIAALENEISILRSLSSPYVVQYLGDDVTVESPSGPGITTSFRNLHMEYLPGGTVSNMARTRYNNNSTPRGHGSFGGGVDDEGVIKKYTFCIASGLKHLHSQGIVHCDVKGENVLVGPTTGTAKLADFGSAIHRCNNYDKKMMIVPRGSPLWMAPEVVRGEYQGSESDVWSLGCTVIEMVTGKPAWEDKGVAETLCRIGYSDELPRLPTRLSELGRDFVEKCLRREVNERWSCDQLLQHPFISMCTPLNLSTHTSPRCVLDWFNLESDEEDDHEEGKPSSSICDSEVRGRIGKLASNRGVIWESEGWVEVRGLVSESEGVSLAVSDAGCCGDEEAKGGAKLKYRELTGLEVEVFGAELGYVDSIGIAEFSGRTSGEHLVDSNYSAVVQAYRLTYTTTANWALADWIKSTPLSAISMKRSRQIEMTIRP